MHGAAFFASGRGQKKKFVQEVWWKSSTLLRLVKENDNLIAYLLHHLIWQMLNSFDSDKIDGIND